MARKVQGLQALGLKLKRLPQETRSAIRQALAEGADEVVAMQRHLAPVEDGDLRDSIVATFGDDTPAYAAFRARRGAKKVTGNDRDELTVRVTAGNTRVRYAHLVEFGTAPHVSGGYMAGGEHPGTAAQPFFYPGYRATKRSVKAKVAKAIRLAAKRVASGG